MTSKLQVLAEFLEVESSDLTPSSYDGQEYEYSTSEVEYYIYRIN